MERVEDPAFPPEMGFGDTAGPAENAGKPQDDEEGRRTHESFAEGVGRAGAQGIARENPAEKEKQDRHRQGEPERDGKGLDRISDLIGGGAARLRGRFGETLAQTAAWEKEHGGEDDGEEPFARMDSHDGSSIFPDCLGTEERDKSGAQPGEGVLSDGRSARRPDEAFAEIISQIVGLGERLAHDEVGFAEKGGEATVCIDRILPQSDPVGDELGESRPQLREIVLTHALRAEEIEQLLDLALGRRERIEFTIGAESLESGRRDGLAAFAEGDAHTLRCRQGAAQIEDDLGEGILEPSDRDLGADVFRLTAEALEIFLRLVFRGIGGCDAAEEGLVGLREVARFFHQFLDLRIARDRLQAQLGDESLGFADPGADEFAAAGFETCGPLAGKTEVRTGEIAAGLEKVAVLVE